jgi:hypothetical protein
MPDDPDIEYMDPIMRAWMFYNWIEDYNDEFKLLENQGYLIGSFTNPEAVQKILGKGDQQHASTDEEFEELSNKLFTKQDEKLTHRRRKRKIQE